MQGYCHYQDLTEYAKETLQRRMEQPGNIFQGCEPKFKKYQFKCGVLDTANGELFGTPVREGISGDHLLLKSDSNIREAVLDILVEGSNPTTGDVTRHIGIGRYRYNGQDYPKIKGLAGSSLEQVVEQGNFMNVRARDAGINGANVECYPDFGQLDPLEIALKNYLGTGIAANDLSIMILTATTFKGGVPG